MIKKIMLFPNGAVASFNEAGEQVPEWQDNLFCSYLRKMKDAGVVDSDTQIASGTASGMRDSKLRDWV
jgi:hypothetical protein